MIILLSYLLVKVLPHRYYQSIISDVLLQDEGTQATNFYCVVIIAAVCNFVVVLMLNVPKPDIAIMRSVLPISYQAPVWESFIEKQSL